MADASPTNGDAGADGEGAAEAEEGFSEEEQVEAEAAAPEPPPPADLHAVLREPRIRLLSWISLVSAAGAFPSSKLTRELLSSRISVEVMFDIYTREEMLECTNAAAARSGSKSGTGQLSTASADLAARRKRVQRIRARLPYTPAEGPLRVYLKFTIGEVPIRGAVVNRTLNRNIPMVKWTDCGEVRMKCCGSLPSVDHILRGKIGALSEADELEFLEDPTVFRSLERLTLSMSAVTSLPPDFCMPQVRRLKLVCRDSAFSTQTLASIHRAFPGLMRLHIAVSAMGLLPLCGPGFLAPPDFRISLLDEYGKPLLKPDDGKGNLFVASHLMTLPFSWSGALFENVIRLQMTELCQDHEGLAMEQLAAMVRSMPRLRRLGTVSMRAFQLIDLAREDCLIEELVLIMNMLDVIPLFRTFLAVEQSRRRATLRRLAVHMQAGDGVGRPTVEVENSMCAGWYVLATSLIRPDGFVCFSFGHRQIAQTALAQLAWFDPKHYCLDWADYEDDGRLPGSTSLQRPLLYYSTEGVVRPRGTLVAGSLRPAASDDAKGSVGALLAEATVASLAGQNAPVNFGRRKSLAPPGLNSGGRTPSASPTPGNTRRRMSFMRLGSTADVPLSPVRHAFMDIPLIDAYESMVKFKQEDRL